VTTVTLSLGPADAAQAVIPTRVVVVDDHRTFAELLTLAINETADLICLGQAVSAKEGRVLVDQLRPDIVLMDVELPDGDGIALTRELRRAYPQLRVVVLTSHSELGVAARAAAAGAGAFVRKDGALKDVLSALRTVRNDAMLIAPATLASGAATHDADAEGHAEGHAGGGARLDQLTPRELDVLRLLAGGCDAAKIARRLGISDNTCRGYLKSLFAKLGVHSQLEAVVVAARSGVIDFP
jgi:DNA-binding NarL/FixJ family response regulator